MDKFKDFSRRSFIACVWFLFYLIAQTISAIALFLIKMFTDTSFVKQFLELFAPIYSEEATYSLSTNLEVINLFNQLFNNFINYTLILTGIIVISIAFVIFKSKKNNKLVNDENISLTKREILLLFVGGVSFNILISAGIYFLVPREYIASYSAQISNLSSSDLWIINLISVGIVSPIVEEIIFRYGIMGCFIDLSPVLAIFYQAILFATVHGSPIQMIYTFILGITFGYLTYNTRSILPSMLLHISLNSSTIIVSNLFANNEFIGLFYSIFVIFISFYIANHFRKK